MQDQYPFISTIYELSYIRELYENIKKGSCTTICLNDENSEVYRYRGNKKRFPLTWGGKKKTIVLVDDCKDENYLVSDYFQEPVRIKCKNINYRFSPYELFHLKRNHHLWKNLVTSESTPLEIRNALYSVKFRDCDVFPIGVVLHVLQLFKPKKVLDMSAGWGDRLLAATMYKDLKLYCGCDPNTDLFSGYEKMLKTFVPKEKYKMVTSKSALAKSPPLGKNKYILINNAFQNTNLPKTKFDLMFSSPPYFIAEQYSEHKNQSYKTSGKDLNRWLKDFIYPSMNKIWSHLNKGGHLIYVLNDVKIHGRQIFYTEKIHKYVSRLPSASYEGMVGFRFSHKRSAQPMWIFKKN